MKVVCVILSLRHSIRMFDYEGTKDILKTDVWLYLCIMSALAMCIFNSFLFKCFPMTFMSNIGNIILIFYGGVGMGIGLDFKHLSIDRS
jgi:hypothetical protein